MRADPRLIVVPTLLLALALPPAAGARPAAQLQDHIGRVLAVLADTARTPDDRLAAVRALAADVFDYAEAGRQALGRHWQERGPAERQEFVRLFTELIERGYLARIGDYRGEQVQVRGERVEGDGAVVRARIVTADGTEVDVDFRMRPGAAGRWRVWDVVIDGVSLVASYRAQFNKILRTSSWEALLARLRGREAALAREP